MSKLQQKSQLKCKEIKVKYVLWNYVENCNYSTNLRTYKKCIFYRSQTVSRVKTVLKMSYGYHHEPYGFCRFSNYFFFVLQVLVLLSILSLLMGIYAILYLSV